MPTTPIRYFKKLSPEQGFVLSNGRVFKFPDFGNGFGGVDTDNERLIAEFGAAIAKSRGGLEEITQEAFEELKKKEVPPDQSQLDSVSLDSLRRLRSGQNRAAAVGDTATPSPSESSGGLKVPTSPSKATGFKPKSVMR